MDFFVSLLGLSSMILTPIFLIIAIIFLIKKKTSNKWFIAMGISMVVFIICLTIPTCGHKWSEATCIQPKTCTLCGKTDGEPNEQHNWKNATCQNPKECIDCGKIMGDPIEHKWKDATCAIPKTCLECGTTSGDRLEHEWIDATCESPKTCKLCGTTEGGTTEHIEGDWQFVRNGAKELYCVVCNEILDKKVGIVENIYTATDIPNRLMNDEFKAAIDLFSKGFSQSGLEIANATTYNDGETYIFYLDHMEFLGDECKDDYFQPRIIYSGDAINNNGTPNKLFFEIPNPLKSNGYEETVELVENIAEALDISDVGLIDNDYSSSSKLAIGKYATFTFLNLGLELTVSNTDGTVEIEIVPIE